MTNNLDRYSKICPDCATKEGGICYKTELWFTETDCEICGEKTGCISARDYNLPKIID